MMGGSAAGIGLVVSNFVYSLFYYVFVFGLVLWAAMLIKEGNKAALRRYIVIAVVVGLIGMLLTSPGLVSGWLR